MKLKPQTQAVLDIMREAGSISAREAMAMHPPCYRLAPRILEIRRALGEERVRTEYEEHDGGRHARYFWVVPEQADLFGEAA